MTPEEYAKKFVASLDVDHHGKCDNQLDTIERAAADAFRAALAERRCVSHGKPLCACYGCIDQIRAEERELCAKAICDYCDRGTKRFTDGDGDMYHEIVNTVNPATNRPYWWPCEAEAIWQLDKPKGETP